MAWNGYPNNFNFGGQMPMQTQNVMQNCYMPIEVRDEAEAKTYPVAANTTVALICFPANKFWIKSTNASGTVVAFRTFDFTEKNLVDFGANVAIPTGETVGEISLAITIDGTTIPSSQMIVTPAAVEQFFNVSRAINAEVFKPCGCQTVTVRNTSAIPVLVQNANIIFNRPDLAVTR